jgi:leader peptidase (prepilin peptidase) / N-methyltransferase
MIPVVITAGVLGSVIGSFLNVVIYRVPIKRSIVSPPSACPHCGTHIAWYDNIPVISWIILRGKCRNCADPISVRYPLVELGTAIFFVLVSLVFGPAILAASSSVGILAASLALVAFLYLASISVTLTLIDIDTHTLPNAIVLPALGVGAVLLGASSLLVGDLDALLRAGIGGASLFIAYYLMAILYPGGMGFGDVKLAAVLGLYTAWLGWGPLAVGALAAFFLGGIFGVVLLVARRAKRKTRIPFGPWMLAGAWVGIFFGEPVSAWYLGLFGLA